MKSENDYNKFLQEVKSYFEKEGLILEEEVTEHEIIHYTVLLYSYHNRYISVGIQDNENNLYVSFYFNEKNNDRKNNIYYSAYGIPFEDFSSFEEEYKFFIEIMDLYERKRNSDVLTVPVSAVTLDYATVQSILARLDLIGETLNDIDDTISAPGTGILARLDALENPSEYAGHKRIDKNQCMFLL